MNPDHLKAARELLAFYREAGVDAVLGETAVDQFADRTLSEAPAPSPFRPAAPAAAAAGPAAPAAPSPAPPRPVLPGIAPPSAEAAVMAAREAARSAGTLEELRA